MAGPIVYIDRSRVREGRLAELRRAIDELVPFIEAHEPQLLSYGFYLDEQESRMTVVAVHPDSASVERHMEVGGPAFRRFARLIEIDSIEVYGEPGDRVIELLRRKADLLGEHGEVIIGRLHRGFSRLQ